MDLLAEKIRERLRFKKSCTIFETDLGRVWPWANKEKGKRIAQIQAFAEARGWTAQVFDPGLRVTFRKAAPEEPSNASAGNRTELASTR